MDELEVAAGSWKDTAGTVVTIGAVVAGSLLIALYFFQNKLLYFPGIPPNSRQLFFSAKDFHLEGLLEEIFFDTSDGETLQAYFVKNYKRTRNSPTMIYFHGNAGNISQRLGTVGQISRKLNCNVLIVSYRGYGKSTGTPTEKGLGLDAAAALSYLRSTRKDVNASKIFVFGRSLGGAVAVDLAFREGPKLAGLIIENTFTSIPDMVTVVMPFLKYFRAMSSNQWRSIDKIKKITIPTLFLSGQKDELVPAPMMAALFKNSGAQTKEFAPFAGGTHMDTYMQQGYYEKVGEFIESVLGQSTVEDQKGDENCEDECDERTDEVEVVHMHKD